MHGIEISPASPTWDKRVTVVYQPRRCVTAVQ